MLHHNKCPHFDGTTNFAINLVPSKSFGFHWLSLVFLISTLLKKKCSKIIWIISFQWIELNLLQRRKKNRSKSFKCPLFCYTISIQSHNLLISHYQLWRWITTKIWQGNEDFSTCHRKHAFSLCTIITRTVEQIFFWLHAFVLWFLTCDKSKNLKTMCRTKKNIRSEKNPTFFYLILAADKQKYVELFRPQIEETAGQTDRPTAE